MASQALAIAGQAPIQEHSPEFWEVVGKLMAGNWSGLSPEQKVSYARYVCESLHLNPATSPVRFIKTKQGEAFYLTKDATDQLRKMNGVSTEITGERQVGDAYVVTARATLPGGRVEESTGAVWIKGLFGDDYVNALMKAETKAKRRVTLSICGLGFLDESETETVRGRAMIPGSAEDAGDAPREVRELPPQRPAARTETPPSTLPQTRNKLRVAAEVPEGATGVTVTMVDPDRTQKAHLVAEEPDERPALLKKLWGLAVDYYGGRDKADTALHEWIGVGYPEATKDGKPSLRALTAAQMQEIIDAIEAAPEEAEVSDEAAHLDGQVAE